MKTPTKLFGLAKHTYEALVTFTFVEGGECVPRYLARVAATYLGQQHSAVRQMEVHGNPAFGVEVPKDDGRLIHVWYRQSAHVKYVTYYFAKDPAKAADENLVYTAQMPQKVGGDAGASSSSSKAKKK